MRRSLCVLLFVLLITSCGDDDTAPADGGADGGCATDFDCDDGQHCNGAELCVAGRCESATDPCGDGERCDESADLCRSDCDEPDMDGDGHDAVECGGDDCDDGDIAISPSSFEVCDAEGIDEDCDAEHSALTGTVTVTPPSPAATGTDAGWTATTSAGRSRPAQPRPAT